MAIKKTLVDTHRGVEVDWARPVIHHDCVCVLNRLTERVRIWWMPDYSSSTTMAAVWMDTQRYSEWAGRTVPNKAPWRTIQNINQGGVSFSPGYMALACVLVTLFRIAPKNKALCLTGCVSEMAPYSLYCALILARAVQIFRPEPRP
jgi:hypothetical protein